MGQECSRQVYNAIEMKMNRDFNAFTDFESPELEVPTFCLVTGCVSARRDRRYIGSMCKT